MIRTTALLLFVAFFSVYAWRNWFVSLCSAILLLAVVEHPDFPKSVAGIPGLNPWNILMLSILAAWAARRGEEGYQWDMPPVVGRLLFVSLAVLLVGVIRLVMDDYPSGFSATYIFGEFVVNSVKWVLPGLLLFDACRTRQRAAIGLGVVLCLYFLLAVQTIRWMPLSEIASGDSLSERASKITQNEIGYNRVTLSNMLAGASWAALGTVPLLRQNWHRLVLLGGAGAIAFGQALTGGRTGYVAWIAIGLILAAIRWRKLLLVIPVALVAVAVSLPAVRERMLQGFGGQEGNIAVSTSTYSITSGRDIAWPVVIDAIADAPFIGYGRQAMVTSGARDYLMAEYRESFPHPHQAYLELLLDNGIVGFLLVIPLFLYVLVRSLPLVRVRDDPLLCAIGCTSFCLVLALLVGAFGGLTFYPREGSVGMWAAIGLMLRAYVQTRRAWETGAPVFPDELPEKWFVRGDEAYADGDAYPLPDENTSLAHGQHRY